MINPKTRKTGTTSTAALSQSQQQQQRLVAGTAGERLLEEQRLTSTDSDANGQTSTATSGTEHNDAEEEEEEEDEADSCSSFSLQECINEFRARRIRRLSTQSGEREPLEKCVTTGERLLKEAPVGAPHIDPEDVDLIKQNRSNKEQERKCKPCRNGFCYCFTSDSGDGGGGCAAREMLTRGAHVRQPRRSRKSESSQGTQLLPQNQCLTVDEQRRQSAPATLKALQKSKTDEAPQTRQTKRDEKMKRVASTEVDEANSLTAISRLETTNEDAPLIHIIQELHNNCVISEVRVNKQKIQAQQRSRSLNTGAITATTTSSSSPNKSVQHEALELHAPSAPPIEGYSPSKHLSAKRHSPTAPELDKITELDSLPDAFAYSTPLNGSVKSNGSTRRKHRAGGRLLQKRLSHGHVPVRMRRSTQPPPKPPRSYLSLEEKSTVSSLASTTPSVREAERAIDEFLRKRGVKVPTATQTQEKSGKTRQRADKWVQAGGSELQKVNNEALKREKRKSCPLMPAQSKSLTRKPLHTYPSLSDIERSMEGNSKKYSNYEKNICQVAEKPVKELSFGWKEPKISEMLNYDRNANKREFKSQAVQAEPQQALGWQMPPKLDIDTVDGGVCHNLASNIEAKNTPVKTPPISTEKRRTQKFIWSEQLRNLSPWNNHKIRNGGRNIKSNLKSSSHSLFNCSKKKILRLVTPKKENWQRHNSFERHVSSAASSRTVAVQTSPEDLRSYELSLTPQSPPGSYHSAVQTSTQSTTPTCSQNTNNAEAGDFDFTRTVRSPPKKAPRAATQRKLNFPFHCGTEGCMSSGDNGTLSAAGKTKTYRSFHGDLDQDVTLSKLGYILGNIRAKLEASDDHAVRTFQEIERREQQAGGMDCPDGRMRAQQIRAVVHHHRAQQQFTGPEHDPIYSEIEEDSIHISSTPQYDNTTGIQHFSAAHVPEVLYAKVNKPQRLKKQPAPLPPTPLGKILHESLRNVSLAPTTPLPPLLEQPSSDVSYSSPPHDASFTSSLSHCHSLNNIRVMEQHSPPKRDRNLSKSDLSLHRSEIFLDNLCRSEIIVESGELERLEKVNNDQQQNLAMEAATAQCQFTTSTPTPNDSISYDTPDDADFGSASNTAGSQLGLSMGATSRYAGNQSTPKKTTPPTFTTKSQSVVSSPQQLKPIGRRRRIAPPVPQQSSSCPVTPQKLPLATKPSTSQLPLSTSLIEVCPHDVSHTLLHNESVLNNSRDNQSNAANTSISQFYLTHFNRLKSALRKSLRRGKKFVRNETKRLSNSFSFPASHAQANTVPDTSYHNQSDGQLYSETSTFDLERLFSLDEQEPVVQQLAKTVSICRQLPNLEISEEMVEAERLLLFSALRREVKQQKLVLPRPCELQEPQQVRRFYIDTMQLPVRADVNQDIFFNYFYIVAFECGGVIKSTKSAECHNGEAVFCDCGIEFSCALGQEEVEMHGEVFMLRLRKLSPLSLEPRRPVVKVPTLLTPSTKSCSSSSSDEISSRFRLHATFKLSARDFAPFEYVECESQHGDKICLRAARTCKLPLTARTKSTNLVKQIQLTGRAEVRFPKQTFSGFLNVQDPHTLHSWNRRWVILAGVHVGVWADASEMTLAEQPLLSLDFRSNLQSIPLEAAPRELCARPRAFCLQCALHKAGEEVATAAVFFAADTQAELNAWLVQLNAALQLVATWMS